MRSRKGLRSVSWDDVSPDQKVWLVGTHEGKPVAYGPHFVVDPAKRLLRNSKRQFTHYSEDLLMERSYVLCTPTDPHPGPDDGGVIGQVSSENAYLKVYATYSGPRPEDLAVGEHTTATIGLSGETAEYKVWRVG